ncbi:MAG: hypothetical protein WC294_02230 [Methanoregula sp.]|jgi:hypothetical protein
MTRLCSICTHKKLQEINAELAIETTYREISHKFKVSKSALNRHRQHLPVPLIAAAQRLKVEEAAAATTGDPDVLTQVKDLNTRATRILNDCEKDKDRHHEIAAMREARGLLELQSRLMGQIGPSTAVQVNIAQTLTSSREWPVLMRVLSNHPEIKDELNTALQGAGL